MITWPADLVNAIARRRAVLYLGAGVSMNSTNEQGKRPPSWEQFLRAGIDACAGSKKEMQGLLKRNDWLTCCQLIKYRMGMGWIPFVESQFATPLFKPHEIHDHIFRLDSSFVLTPNFDRIYDDFAVSRLTNRVIVKSYHDDDVGRCLRGNEAQRFILKVHGTINTPGKLVFTREEYADIRAKHSNFYLAVSALILTHTFVFVGCGMNDPDIALLLEEYSRSFADSPAHYFVTSMRPSDDYRRMMEKNFSLVPIKYSANNDHLELTQSLKALGALVDERRDELSKGARW